MTISDLAEYLQVSKSSLYKLVQSGRVPGQKVGKHWRFHREVINSWFGLVAPQAPTIPGEPAMAPSTTTIPLSGGARESRYAQSKEGTA